MKLLLLYRKEVKKYFNHWNSPHKYLLIITLTLTQIKSLVKIENGKIDNLFAGRNKPLWKEKTETENLFSTVSLWNSWKSDESFYWNRKSFLTVKSKACKFVINLDEPPFRVWWEVGSSVFQYYLFMLWTTFTLYRSRTDWILAQKQRFIGQAWKFYYFITNAGECSLKNDTMSFFTPNVIK